MSTQPKYKLGRGIFHIRYNTDGMRHCCVCDKLLMVSERIDTEDDANLIEAYCFPCYRLALETYEPPAT